MVNGTAKLPIGSPNACKYEELELDEFDVREVGEHQDEAGLISEDQENQQDDLVYEDISDEDYWDKDVPLETEASASRIPETECWDAEDSLGRYNEHSVDALNDSAHSLKALCNLLEDNTTDGMDRLTHIDMLCAETPFSPEQPDEEVAKSKNRLPNFTKLGDYIPGFTEIMAQRGLGPAAAMMHKPLVSTTPRTHDTDCIRSEDEEVEVSFSGFLLLGSQKVKHVKNLQIRWAQIQRKGPDDTDWWLVWYAAREAVDNDKDKDAAKSTAYLSTLKNNSSLTISSLMDEFTPNKSVKSTKPNVKIIDGMVILKKEGEMRLTGSTIVDNGIEAITHNGSGGVWNHFSVYPPPEIRKYPLDFACEKSEDAGRWVLALRACTSFSVPKDLAPKLSGRLHVSVCEASVKRKELYRVRKTKKIPNLFVLLKFDRYTFRTSTIYSNDKFVWDGHLCEFPVLYDDPDYFLTIEVWDGPGKGQHTEESESVAVVSVPLIMFERNVERKMTVKLRSRKLIESGYLHEGSDIGEVVFQYRYEHQWCNFFLSIPRQRLRQERSKEIEGGLRDRTAIEMKNLNLFTARLQVHLAMGKRISNRFLRILRWMDVGETICCLFAITLYVLWLYVYTLPLVVAGLWVISIHRHPHFKDWFRRGEELGHEVWESDLVQTTLQQAAHVRESLRNSTQHMRNSIRTSANQYSPMTQLTKTNTSGEKKQEPEEEDGYEEAGDDGSQDGCAEEVGDGSPDPGDLSGLVTKVLKVYENERTVLFGRWSHKRLRLWDPPAYSDCVTGEKMPLKWIIDNISYRWNVEITECTDENGWQYGTSFRDNMWSNSFAIMTHNVRRRKHIGTPIGSAKNELTRNSSRVLQKEKLKQTKKTTNAKPTMTQKLTDAAPHKLIVEKVLAQIRDFERASLHWLDWLERRRNLFGGKKAYISTVMVFLLSVLLIITLIFPTQLLILTYAYLFFWAGWSDGVYYRGIRDKIITRMKDEMRGSLENVIVDKWDFNTPMRDIVEVIGVDILQKWITREYFEAPVSLKDLHALERLENLADFIISRSALIIRRRERRRAWSKMSFSAFLDHVPSDECDYDAASITYYKNR